MTDLDWSAPFDNDEVSLVTPVPYGDLHTVSPYVATPQVSREKNSKQIFFTKFTKRPSIM